MFEAFQAVGWRNRFVTPALRQAALQNVHLAALPDCMILVELWLWAVFFRFSGEYRSLAPDKQEKLRNEAFQLSFFGYRNVHKDRLATIMREFEPNLGLTEPSKILVGFQQLIRPTFEHGVIEAQHLPPLHENFDLSTLRRVLSKVHPSFLEMPGIATGAYERERQHNLKLIVQVAAVGQAQLYARLTGILIPAGVVLIDEEQIPDLCDVFISYARSDGRFVAELAARLEKLGMRAWYDRRIQPETQFDQSISEQISAAKIVLTVWSSAAVSSKWVRAESLAGFNADKLLQLRFGGCSIPTPFNIIQAMEIEADGLAPETYETLIQAIRRKIGAAPNAEGAGTSDVGLIPRYDSEPWYYDEKQWRDAFVAPALRDAEPNLFVKDTKVGGAAALLLETFFWGLVLKTLQMKIPTDRMNLILPMWVATAPRQHWEAARERGADIDGPVSMEFVVLFHKLVDASVQVFEIELQTHAGLLSHTGELFKQFLNNSEKTISSNDRHAAFPVSAADGDALLLFAALAGTTKLLDALNSNLLRQ